MFVEDLVEHRHDDKPEVIDNRLDVYEKNTAPLKSYYQKAWEICFGRWQWVIPKPVFEPHFDCSEVVDRCTPSSLPEKLPKSKTPASIVARDSSGS